MDSTLEQLDTYCYKCGTAWRDEWIACEKCGGRDPQYGEARPTVIIEDDAARYPGPWSMIAWPRPGVVMIVGGPGLGKSSLAAMLCPSDWITSEQAPKPVKPLFDRIAPGHMPTVHTAKTPAHVAAVLQKIRHGPVVCDSLSAFGIQGALVVAQLLVEWAIANDERVLGVVQVNKGGDAAGLMALPHLVDAVVILDKDDSGLRLFHVDKCRWSPEGSVYWAFGARGEIIQPDFPAAYSVEGTTTYWLQIHPMGRARWNHLLKLLERLDMLEPGVASAAHYASYMPNSFIEPRDLHQRRAFAEEVGLRWISPADVMDDVMDTLERQRGDDEHATPLELLRNLMKG